MQWSRAVADAEAVGEKLVSYVLLLLFVAGIGFGIYVYYDKTPAKAQNFIVEHDDKRCITCYVTYQGGISCVPDVYVSGHAADNCYMNRDGGAR